MPSTKDEEKPQAKVPSLHSPAHQPLSHRPAPNAVVFVEPYSPPGAKRCPICHKRYTGTKTLNMHVKEVHSGQKCREVPQKIQGQSKQE